MKLTVGLGVLLFFIPTCILIPAWLTVRHYRYKWREKKEEQRRDVERSEKTYKYDNLHKVDSEEL